MIKTLFDQGTWMPADDVDIRLGICPDPIEVMLKNIKPKVALIFIICKK